MGQKLQGFIIRKYRQERKWSQSSLCRGICAVSYLSKIEQGKAEGEPGGAYPPVSAAGDSMAGGSGLLPGGRGMAGGML